MTVNRSLARNVAKVKAKKAGLSKVCKHGRNDRSWFSIHWRSLVKKGV